MNLCTPKSISDALSVWAPLAVGVSGGKDSCAVALAVADYVGDYKGPKILIHSDLGTVEWKDSLPSCQRLADRIGWELVVVRRAAGGMMERWEQRWHNNVERYINLECVKLILPWSTPSMRFCTSELKSAVIASELKRLFGGASSAKCGPGVPILSVTGIRGDESKNRAKTPIVKPNPRLTRVSDGTYGLDWHAIHSWTEADVFACMDSHSFERHEAYRVFGSSRVSCCFCIMSSKNDLEAASACTDNHAIFRRMVGLEITSTFSFQDKWLADTAPQLLDPATIAQLEIAKLKAELREKEEARIPKRLEYVQGWPVFVPNIEECALIASVRLKVSEILGLDSNYLTPGEVQARYQQLMDEKAAKQSAA